MTATAPPRRFVLEPTYGCTLACQHCYIQRSASAAGRSAQLNHTQPLSFWLDLLGDLPCGTPVHFTGGEIFHYGTRVFELFERAAARGPFSMVTNGLRLTTSAVARLARLGPSNVTVSLHGTAQVHDALTRSAGSFDAAVAGLCRLVDALPPSVPSVNFTLLPLNHAVLLETIAIVEELCVRSMVVQLFDPALWRTGIAAGVVSPKLPSLERWSSQTRKALTGALESIAARPADASLSVRLASDMRPEEIAGFCLTGHFNPEEWSCSESFDTMRFDPGGRVYTCTGQVIGSAGERGWRELWEDPSYVAFREQRANRRCEAACAGCCKVRRDVETRDGRAALGESSHQRRTLTVLAS